MKISFASWSVCVVLLLIYMCFVTPTAANTPGCGSDYGVVLQGDIGKIEVPSPYDGVQEYDNSMSCEWRFAPVPNREIRIRIVEFATEANRDVVTLNPGARTLSGVLSPFFLNFNEAADETVVQFTSDSTVTRSGFSLQWHAVEPPPPACTSPTTIGPGMGQSGAFSVPAPYNGLAFYLNDMDCKWVFDFPGQTVLLSFTPSEFIISGLEDFVTIYPINVTLAGYPLPEAVTYTLPGTASVEFHSDHSGSDTGFRATWSVVPSPPSPPSPSPPPPTSSTAAAAALASPDSSDSSFFSSTGNILIVTGSGVALCLCLAIAGGLAFFFVRRRNQNAPPKPATTQTDLFAI